MFAPTKTWRRWHRKVSVNERRYAIVSALAGSAIPALVMARGHHIDAVPEVPLVVDNKAVEGIDKTAKAVALLKKIHAFEDVQKAKDSRKIRRGKGKMRNRRYVSRRGPLVIYHEAGPLVKAFRNIPGVELANVNRLNLLQLAPGGHLGRFCVWTRDAFERLEALYGTYKKGSTEKNGYRLPRPMMVQADLARIINSDEVQSHLREKQSRSRVHPHRKNPLKNFGFLVKLNPHAKVVRRRVLLAKEASSKKKAALLEAKRKGTAPKKAAGPKVAKVRAHKRFSTTLFSK